MSTQYIAFQELIGKTMASVTGTAGDDEINFRTADGEHFRLYHNQDCCESVSVEDIAGNLGDLVGSPILQAEEATQDDPDNDELGMWTFYKLATAKGYVTIRWYGSSNGYYSVSVSFAKVTS